MKYNIKESFNPNQFKTLNYYAKKFVQGKLPISEYRVYIQELLRILAQINIIDKNILKEKSIKPYKKYFKEDDTWAPGKSYEKCESCEEDCNCRQCDLKETCPEGSIERNGKCAKSDNSGYYKGVCAKGYHFDKVHDSCVKMTDK